MTTDKPDDPWSLSTEALTDYINSEPRPHEDHTDEILETVRKSKFYTPPATPEQNKSDNEFLASLGFPPRDPWLPPMTARSRQHWQWRTTPEGKAWAKKQSDNAEKRLVKRYQYLAAVREHPEYERQEALPSLAEARDKREFCQLVAKATRRSSVEYPEAMELICRAIAQWSVDDLYMARILQGMWMDHVMDREAP